MKKNILAILVFTLTSCNTFDEKKVMNYKPELENLVSKFAKYDTGTYHRDDIDEFIIEEIRDLDIDFVVKNGEMKNPSYSGFIEGNDSIIIFIQKSRNIFNSEKRIIFDFNKKPQNYGSNEIPGAAYKIVQINERWYYSEEGFD